MTAGKFNGVLGPAKTFSPIELYHLRLNAGGDVTLPFPRAYNTAFLMMAGEVALNDEDSISQHELVLFNHDGDVVRVTAKSDSELLVMSGEPIDEPVVQYGPFVMNTEQEIEQAFSDFSENKFGHLT